MKRRLLFILSLLLPTLLMANPVGKEQAQEKALSFLNGRSAAKARGPKAASNLRLVMSQDCYHVFNIGTGDGFVIVSGDDCAPDILGYADSGTIDPQSMPDNMKAWLQGYADQIEWMKAHGVKAEKSFTTRAAKSPISPLLTSEWNQGTPYNNECPTYIEDENTVHYVTGCVATAMAQLMYYHKHPTSSTTAIPEYIPTGDNAGCPTLPALEATTFNWGDMQDTYSKSDAGTEVAKLMKYCGTATRMNYREGGSGTSTSNAVDALKNYFGYSNDAKYLGRDGYSYSQWIDIVYQELAANRPVLYDGQSAGGGHAFICDGFDEDDLFHINWGWGGMSNGYFRLSILASDQQGAGGSTTNDGYRMWQSIGVGIEPVSTSPTYPDPVYTSPELTINSVTISGGALTGGTPHDITISITNNSSTEAFHDDITIALMNGAELSSGIIQQLGGTMTDIEPNQTKEITISVTSDYTGSMYLGVIRGFFGYGTKLYSEFITINSASPSGGEVNIALDALSIKNSHGSDVYGNAIYFSVNAANNSSTDDYSNGFTITLYKTYDWVDNGGGSWTYSYKAVGEKNFTDVIAKNDNKTFTATFKDLDYGEQYFIRFGTYSYSGSTRVYNRNEAGLYTICHGFITIDSEGDITGSIPTPSVTIPDNAITVDLRGQTTVTSITPNTNPNCIYLFDGTADVPSGISSNIVKGTTAESITLTDGYDFYSPIDFTASNISYTRTITTGYTVTDGKSAGWTTINLPFDVANIEADGNTIDWFHSSSDTGKNFWLAEFTSDNSTGVTFDYATTLKANTPYIIAVPGNQWGSKWDLTGKAITFKGTGANVKANAKAVDRKSVV